MGRQLHRVTHIAKSGCQLDWVSEPIILYLKLTVFKGGTKMIGLTVVLITLYVMFNRCTKQADGTKFCKL